MINVGHMGVCMGDWGEGAGTGLDLVLFNSY